MYVACLEYDLSEFRIAALYLPVGLRVSTLSVRSLSVQKFVLKVAKRMSVGGDDEMTLSDTLTHVRTCACTTVFTNPLEH